MGETISQQAVKLNSRSRMVVVVQVVVLMVVWVIHTCKWWCTLCSVCCVLVNYSSPSPACLFECFIFCENWILVGVLLFRLSYTKFRFIESAQGGLKSLSNFKLSKQAVKPKLNFILWTLNLICVLILFLKRGKCWEMALNWAEAGVVVTLTSSIVYFSGNGCNLFIVVMRVTQSVSA